MTAPVNPWSTPPQNTANEAPAPAAPTPPAAPQAPATPQAPSAPTPPANPLKNDQARNPLAPPAAESADDAEQTVLAVPADSAQQVDPNPTQAEDTAESEDTTKDDDTAESDDKADDTADDTVESDDTDDATENDKAEEKPAPKKRATRRKAAAKKATPKSDGTDPLVAVTELVDNLTAAIERDFTELQSLAPSDALDKIAEITGELDTLNDRAGTAAEKLNELVSTISDYRERGTTLRGAYEAVVNAFK